MQVSNAGRAAMLTGAFAALLTPLAVAGAVAACLGGVLLGTGGTRKLICGEAIYVP